MIKKLLKKISLFIFVALISNNAFAQNDFIGRWLSPSKKGIVETYLQNNKLYGKLVWVKTERKDIYNADKTLRNREVKGLIMLNDFIWKAPQWIEGKIYDAEGGSTYSSKMLLSEDKQTLNVRGYVGFSMLGRTEKFTRVK